MWIIKSSVNLLFLWLYRVCLYQIKYINTDVRKKRCDRVGKRTKGSKM